MLQNRHVERVKCNNCKTEYEAKPNEPPEGRTRCPICSSTARLAFQSLEAKVAGHPKLSYKGRRGSGGKPFIQGIIGDDLFRKTQEWMRLERVIDRDNDQYKEVVIDPTTGAVIHQCEEPAQRKQTRPLPNKPQAKPVQSEKPKEPELWPISWITVAEAPLDRVRWSTASYDGFRKLRGGTDVLQDIDAYLNKPIPPDYDEKS